MNKMENIKSTNLESFIEASDVVVSPESGLAIVVIKPDAFKNRNQIIKRLENSGLYVVKSVSKNLPDNFVINQMYRDLPRDIEEETLRHFNFGPSEIILLRGGEKVVDKVVLATGLSINPVECDENSIRYLFSEHFGRETDAGKIYHRNAVHRAKDKTEKGEDLHKFESFLG